MLSRNNKILIGCLALLLVMSVGYALFSDTITINGSATAKGDFVLTTECISGIPEEIDTSVSELSSFYNQNFGANFGTTEGGYKNESCIANGTTVNYNADFLYPSALKVYTLKITNTGSIPALFDLFNMDNSSSNVAPYNIESQVIDYYVGGKSIANRMIEVSSLGLSEEEAIEKILKETVLQPQESMYAIIFTGWDSTDSESSTQTATFNNTITLPFIQATEE